MEITGRLIYFILCQELNAVKIGHTTVKGLDARLKMLQTGNPYQLNVMDEIFTPNYRAEKNLHWLLEEYRINGEWFIFKGGVAKFYRSVFTTAFINELDLYCPDMSWRGGFSGWTSETELKVNFNELSAYVEDSRLTVRRDPSITELTQRFSLSRMTAYLAFKQCARK